MTCVVKLGANYLLGSEFLLRRGVAARAGASSRTDTHGRCETGTEQRGTPGSRRSLKRNSATGTRYLSASIRRCENKQNYGVWKRIDDQSHGVQDWECLAASSCEGQRTGNVLRALANVLA
ncbi:hypothetical protein DPX16_9368 [Anabarilius grahami]|uniref:Uncharacterized protein n=1 Tax=Anabarilius grahami TaxID=495550 RepID=A0A3N0Y6I8_ANAGA|nr:hypothetical protein DPX16_9368 [Anabarilius grahami]